VSKKYLFSFIGIITLFRLIYLNFVPLVPQEAYYWKYAKNLALSYFDHPPMTAYTIAFFTWIGGDHVFFIRIGSVLFSVGLMILLYAISYRLWRQHNIALLTLVVINCTVLFSIGAIIMTPDVPLLFFWTLIVYCMVRLRESGEPKWWLLAGVSLGLSLLSKYPGVLIAPGVFLYLLASASQRKWLRTIYPYAAVLIAVVIFTPVIIWNYQHNWSSFLFQSSNRFSQMTRLRFDFFFQLIGSQMGILTPYIFLLVIIGWVRIGMLSFKEKNEQYALLFWLALPVYAVFTLASFRSYIKMNWLAPAYITSTIAGLAWIYHSHQKMAQFFKKMLKPGLVLGLIIVLFVHLLPIVPLIPIRRGDTWTGWKELATRVSEIKKEMGPQTFIFGHEYKIPSEVSFYTHPHEVTHSAEVIGGKGLQYAYWTNTDQLKNRDAIFITSNMQRFRDLDKLKKYFDAIEPEPPLKIVHHNRTFRIFYIYRCYDYKGPNL